MGKQIDAPPKALDVVGNEKRTGRLLSLSRLLPPTLFQFPVSVRLTIFLLAAAAIRTLPTRWRNRAAPLGGGRLRGLISNSLLVF